MDHEADFARLVASPSPPLDTLALLVASTVRPHVDAGGALARLDELAADVSTPTLDGVRRTLFLRAGFRGDAVRYDDPENSCLDAVLERRLGIPISLSVVLLEVARRVAVPLDGVSMPGHFLVRDKVDRSVFVDAFHEGAVLDAAGAEAVFRRLAGPGAAFEPAWLEPVGPVDIAARMLANLRRIHRASGDHDALIRTLRLRRHLPTVPLAEHTELALLLARRSRFDEAADTLDGALDRVVDDDQRRSLATQARRWRARLN